ncbi:MAG: DNA methyltransferase [bacterium]
MAHAGTRAIEDDGFPFERLSDIAELESWRKELNRPVYHIHKWWAQRLGSVFRAILLASFAPRGSDVLQMFYQPARLAGAVIFDPFMGSGTTIGEALKLGARGIGRDINPVAHFVVRNALTVHSRQDLVHTFAAIARDVAPSIRRLYRARLPDGTMAEVLYYFWVKFVVCPKCGERVDLFSSYVFARHASPRRKPQARAVCPACGAINITRYDAAEATCNGCGGRFPPRKGPAKGATATCPFCQEVFRIAAAAKQRGAAPEHRLYAKMILHPNGTKCYLAADEYDVELYQTACRELRKRGSPYPVVPIKSGYNTDQAINYGYTHWHQMFNERQLLCLSLLAERIRAIPDRRARDLFTCLFSGVLEFNNMFASFKGEGTGAVRHMFSHHVLKPERQPLEANIWGTPKSSGSFSTLFERRVLRALEYCENPFELRVVRKGRKTTSEKVYGLSCPLGHEAALSFIEFQRGKQLYLSCGDSSCTDLSAESVDAVVTDPPFFDNVHYSQLADFFYVWQRQILGPNENHVALTTRSLAEVQHSDAATFSERLSAVWRECHRVLRQDGLLVFTYHHSRAEGWRCILRALMDAGFRIVATQPIKAEMSVAQPKRQAKDPIDLDVIVVCRKKDDQQAMRKRQGEVLRQAANEARHQLARFNDVGRMLSRNDVRVVLMAQIIKRLSWLSSVPEALLDIDRAEQRIEDAIDMLYESQPGEVVGQEARERQLHLW